MNKVYRVVWNAVLSLWQVAGEIGKSRKKSGSVGGKSRSVLGITAGSLFMVSTSLLASELPVHGQIVGGSGSISDNGQQMTIDQTSQRMAIDWTSFSIGADNTVEFIQPGSNAAALNRVTGDQISSIRGALLANGQVFLVNPNGVLFSDSAQVDVGGLVASTLNISTEDFMAGNHRFDGSSNSAVINRGTLTALDGGYVVMIAARVENHGEIFADNGSVLIGAGQRARLDMGGSVKLEIEAEALDAAIRNGGAIYARGGTVMLTAKAAEDLASTVINHSGLIDAQSLGVNAAGQIVLQGDGGITEVSGTLTARNETGTGGNIVVSGDYVGLMNGTHIDASGRDGGGQVRVGGGYQGADPEVSNAQRSYVASEVTIQADALQHGDGGEVIVWADDATRFAGHISARGGEAGGDGGFAEVSGRQYLNYQGTADLRAPQGETGLLMLDPTNITISNAADNNMDGASPFAPSGSDSVLSWASIETGLTTGNVLVTTNSGFDSGEPGHITVADANDYDTPYSLTLQTAENGGVFINGAISNQGTGNFVVTAGTAGIELNAALSFTGGEVNLSSTGVLSGTVDGTITTTALANSGRASGRVILNADQGISLAGRIDTSSSNNEQGQVGNAGQIIISSTQGNIVLGDLVAIGGDNEYAPLDPQTTGGSGGQGGAVNVTSAGGSVTIADINTSGGIGREGVGGGGGTVFIRTIGTDDQISNSVETGNITTTGGANTLGGFNGGNAGNIRLETVFDDTITLNGDLVAIGGASTAPSPQGLGGNITITGAAQLSGNRSITTGVTSGNVTFNSTIDSLSDNTPWSLTVSTGQGDIFFEEAIGRGNNESRELDKLTATGRSISIRRHITARGGVEVTAETITIGDRGDLLVPPGEEPGVIFNSNRDDGVSNGNGAMSFTGQVRLGDHLGLIRGAGGITFSGGSSATAISNYMLGGNNADLSISGTGADGSALQGHVNITGSSTAMNNLGHISLENIGNLTLSGNIAASSLIYRNTGEGNILITGGTVNSVRTFSDSQELGGHDYGIYLETKGQINIQRAMRANQSGARVTVISTGDETSLSDFYSGLISNAGDILVAGIGVSQASSTTSTVSDFGTVNAQGGQIIIDGGGEDVTLNSRLSTTYDESLGGNDAPAVLIRNAHDIRVEAVLASAGTLQFGTPSADLGGGFDVSGNVSQSSNYSNQGIAVKSIAANTDGDISITSTNNNFDELGLIELNGDLHMRSDSGGLLLTEAVSAKSVRLEAGGSALQLGNHNITSTDGNITLRGHGVTQSSGSIVDAGNSNISIDGRTIVPTSTASGNIVLEGTLRTESSSGSAIQIVHTVATNSTIRVGDIEAENGGVILGNTNYSGAISQTAGTVIKADSLDLKSRSSITLSNENEFNDLSGVLYGGTVNIVSLDGMRLTGHVNPFSSTYSQVTLNTFAGGDGSGAALLDINGRNINGNGINLYGKGVQSSGGTINGQGNNIYVNAGGGLIDLSGSTLRTTSTSNNAVRLFNAGDDVVLGNINTTGTSSGAGRLTLGGSGAGEDIRGDITQAAGSVLTVGSLTGTTTGSVTLENNNLIRTGTSSGDNGTLIDFAAGGAFSLYNHAAQGLNISGTIIADDGQGSASVNIDTNGAGLILNGSIAADGVSLRARTGTGHITLGGDVAARAGDVNLVAEGRDGGSPQSSIRQTAGAISTTGSLSGEAIDRVVLNQVNDIAGLGPFTTSSNAFTLNNSGRLGTLTLTGNVSTPTGPTTITTGGLLDISTYNITSTSGLISLHAVGITQAAGSQVNPGGGNSNEAIGAVGGILLDAGGGDITLAGTLATTNTGADSIRIMNADQVQLGEISSSGRVTLGYDENGKRISGEVTQLGALSAAQLQIHTGDAVYLDHAGNQITLLMPVNTVGDFYLTDSSGGLELQGDVHAADDGNIRIWTAVSSLQIKDYDITAEGGGNIWLQGVGISSGENSTIDSGTGDILLDGLNSSTGAVALQGLVTTSSNSDEAVVIQRASNVNFAGITTGTSGTVTLGSSTAGMGIAGNVSQTGALITGTLSGVSGNVVLRHADNAFNQLGPFTSNSGGFDIFSSTGITFSGDVITSGTTRIETEGSLNLDTWNLLATGSTLDLIAEGISQSTSIRVGADDPSTIEGASTLLQAGSGEINLLSDNNNFTGQVVLAATGISAQIRDRASLNLASLIRSGSTGLGSDTGVTAIAGTTLSLAQESINTGAGNIDLRALGGDLQTVGSLSTSSGNIHVQASGNLTVNHSLSSDSGSLSLSGNSVTHGPNGDLITAGSGNISVEAMGAAGDVTMVSGTLYANDTGTISVNAGRNINLTSVSSAGTVNMKADNGYIRDALNSTAVNIAASHVSLEAEGSIGESESNNQELNLSADTIQLTGNSSAFIQNNKSLSLDDISVNETLYISTDGSLYQSTDASISTDTLKLNVAGDALLNNTSNAINTLGNTTVDQSFQLMDSDGDLEISGSVVAGDDSSIVVTDGNLNIDGNIDTLNSSLHLEADGITQTSVSINAADASIKANDGNISLQGSNNFTGTVSLETVDGNAILNDTGSLTLGESSVAGDLTVVAASGINQSGGAITQTEGTQVLFDAGAGALTLDQTDNSFAGAVRLLNSGAHDVRLDSKDALTLGASSVGSGSLNISAEGITQTGALVQAAGAGEADFDGGTGEIDLRAAGNTFTGTVVLRADDAIQLHSDGDQLMLGRVTTDDDLSIQSASAITQTEDSLSIGGTSSINAGANSIDLTAADNEFTGAVSLSNSGDNDVSIRSSAALEFGTVNIGSGAFSAQAASLSQSGTIIQAADAGTVNLSTDSGSINLSGNNDFTGEVNLDSAASITLQDVNTLRTGSITADGNLSLLAYNLTAAGTIDSGGIVSVTADDVFETLEGADIYAEGGFIQHVGNNELRANITTNGNDLQFTGGILLRGNVSLSTGGSSGTVIMLGTLNSNNPPWNMNITTGGNFEFQADVGNISAPGTLIVDAAGSITQSGGTSISVEQAGLRAGGDILLNNAGNNFDVLAAELSGASSLNLETQNGLTIGKVGDIDGLSNNGGSGSVNLTVGGLLNQDADALIALGGDLHIDTTAFNGAHVSINNGSADAGTVLGNTLIAGDFSLISNGDVLQLEDGQSVGVDAFLQVGGTFTLQSADGLSVPVLIEGNAVSDNLIGGGDGAVPGLVRLPGKLSLSMNGTELTVSSDVDGFDPVTVDISTLAGAPLRIISTSNQMSLDQSGVDLAVTAVNLDQANSVNGSLSITTRGAVTGSGGEVKTGISQSSSVQLGEASFEVHESSLNNLYGEGSIILDWGDNSFSGMVNLNAQGADSTVYLASNSDLLLGNARADDNIVIQTFSDSNINLAADKEISTGWLALFGSEILQQSGNRVVAADMMIEADSVSMHEANQIGRLWGYIHNDFSFVNAQSLIIGQDGGNRLLTGNGDIFIRTLAGDLTLANTGTHTIGVQGTGDITLVSAGNFINTSSGGFVETSNGQWQIWSADPSLNTLGSAVSPDFIQYNAVFGDAGKGTVLGSGNGLLYSLAPELSVSLTGTVEREYDAGTDATLTQLNFVIDGRVDGSDSVILGTSAQFEDANVARDGDGQVIGGKLVTIAPEIITASNGSTIIYGYTIAEASESVSANIGLITPRALQVSGITAENRVYDGTATASVDTSAAVFDGLLGGDTVTLSSSGLFVDINAGNGIQVILDNQYGGVSAGNYSITDQATTTADITPFVINLSGDRIYDGTTLVNADRLSTGSLVGSETLQISGAGELDDRHAGDDKTLNIGGLSLADGDNGGLASNYTLTGGNHSVDIARREITVAGITAQSREYDGTTDASIDVSAAAFTNLVAGDDVSVSASGEFVTANAGDGISVNLDSSYSGADLSNYIINDQTSTTADITPRLVTVSGITAGNKTYDGNTDAVLDLSGAVFDRLIAGDDLNVSSASGTFASANAGNGISVNISDSIYSGASLANYSITDQATTTADITPFVINLSGDRIYDGTTLVNADRLSTGSLVGSETLQISGAGELDDRHAGDDKTLNIGGLSLADGDNGGLASNYTLTGGNHSVDIARREITVAGITAQSREYDGTTDASIDVSAAAFTNLVAGDDVSVSASGEFVTANAGDGISVNLDSSYSGADLSNYIINDQTSTTADITPRLVTVSGITAGNKIYDGNTDAVLDLSGAVFDRLITGDDLSVSDAAGAFVSANADTAVTVNLSNLQYSGVDLGNYQITAQETTSADILQRSISVSGITAASRAYDGSTLATVDADGVQFDNLLAGDEVQLDSISGEFASPNAGNGITVNLNATYSGSALANYIIVDQTVTQADITPAVINLNGVRVYDGSALVLASVLEKSGLIANETLGLGGVGMAGSRHVTGSPQLLTDITGLQLQDGSNGGLAANYTLAGGVHQVQFTPAPLKVNGLIAINKVYDGNDAASFNLNAAAPEVLGGDQLVLESVSGYFLSSNAGTGIGVVATDVVLSGADAGNYVLEPVSGLFADILPRQLNITASALDREFDGSTAVDVTLSDNRLEGDELTIDFSAAFLDGSVGDNKFVQVTDISASGADSGNYVLPDSVNTFASILPIPEEEPPVVEPPPQVPEELQDDRKATQPGILDPLRSRNVPMDTSSPETQAADSNGLNIVEIDSSTAQAQSQMRGRDNEGLAQVIVIDGGIQQQSDSEQEDEE